MKLMIYNLGLAAALSAVMVGCASRHPHEQRTDQLIDSKVTAERVQAALHGNSPYGFPRVQVTATNGTVTLSGSVQNEQERQQAAALARSIHRVKQVENRVQIDQSPSP